MAPARNVTASTSHRGASHSNPAQATAVTGHKAQRDRLGALVCHPPQFERLAVIG